MSNGSSEIGAIAKGASINFAGAIFRSVLGLLFVLILSRLLPSSDVGIFFLGLNVISIAMLFSLGGLDTALQRYIAISIVDKDARETWRYLVSALYIIIPALIVTSIFIYVFSDIISSDIYKKPELKEVLVYFIPYLVFMSMAQLLLSVTQGFKKMQYKVIAIDLVNNGLKILFLYLMWLAGMQLFAGVLGNTLAILIAMIMGVVFVFKIMPPLPEKLKGGYAGKILSFSMPVAVARLLTSGNGLVEILISGYFLTASDIGVYAVAIKIVAVGLIVLSSFNIMFSPVISQLHSQQKLAELKALFSSVTRWVFVISAPVFVLMSWFSLSLTEIFGSEYTAGAFSIFILAAGQLFNTLTGPAGNILLMSGYTLTNLAINAVGLFLSITLNILLVPEYGIEGSAIAVSLSLFAMNVGRVYLAWKYIGIHPYDINYFKPVIAIGLVILALIASGFGYDESYGIGPLVLLVSASMCLYCVLIYAFGLNEDDKYILERIASRFKRN